MKALIALWLLFPSVANALGENFAYDPLYEEHHHRGIASHHYAATRSHPQRPQLPVENVNEHVLHHKLIGQHHQDLSPPLSHHHEHDEGVKMGKSSEASGTLPSHHEKLEEKKKEENEQNDDASSSDEDNKKHKKHHHHHSHKHHHEEDSSAEETRKHQKRSHHHNHHHHGKH